MSYNTEMIAAGLEYPEDDALFACIVKNCMMATGLTLTELAEEFSISVPSVERWRSGKTAPHPAMRPQIYRYFLGRLVP